MAAKRKRPSESLFNNPNLSDVKIKLHYEGKVHEYYAHKSVLATGSQFFMNAFAGQFKEASDNVIELHNDVPEHFEIALKFLYTHRYDKDDIVKLVAKDKSNRIFIPIGVNGIADKYDIDLLAECMADDVKATLLTHMKWSSYKAVVGEFYRNNSRAGSPVGLIIAQNIWEDTAYRFLASSECKDLMQQFPCFGADIALEMHGRSREFPCGRIHTITG